MSRKAYFYIAIFLGLLIILLTVGGLYLKHQSFLARRHHLLCEVLKPGMSKDEVLIYYFKWETSQ